MKHVIALFMLGVIVLLTACGKERHPAPLPEMKLIDLGDEAVSVGQRKHLDLDSNGVSDFIIAQFEYFSTIEQAMKREFYIFSFESTYTLTDEDGFLPVYRMNDIIRNGGTEFHEWANVSQNIIARKTTYLNNNAVVWLGDWLNQTRQFIAVKINNESGHSYNGWIEASFDVNTEIVTLHRAALSQVAGRDVKAGE